MDTANAAPVQPAKAAAVMPLIQVKSTAQITAPGARRTCKHPTRVPGLSLRVKIGSK